MISRDLKQGDRVLSLLNSEFPGYHPIIGIARIAHTTEDEKLRFDCHKALARYVEPELKSVEISTAPDSASELIVTFEGEVVDITDDGPPVPALEHKKALPVDELLASAGVEPKRLLPVDELLDSPDLEHIELGLKTA